MNFYDITTGSADAFADARTVRVTVSRDGSSGLVSGYVDGAPAISFTDSGELAVFSEVGNIAHFFIDDTVVSGEASAGVVDYIAIYDSALPTAEIATLDPLAAVPEPGTWALMLAGLAALGWVARRRADARSC